MTPPGTRAQGHSASADALVEAGRRISAELNRKPRRPMALSPQAGEALEELHADYLAELGQESVRIARRNGLSTIDENHVRLACDKIGGPGGRSSASTTIANTIGGVISGAGIASVYNVFFGPGIHTSAEYATAIVLCVLGFVILTIGVMMTFLRR